MTCALRCSAEPRNPLHGDEELKGLLHAAAGLA